MDQGTSGGGGGQQGSFGGEEIQGGDDEQQTASAVTRYVYTPSEEERAVMKQCARDSFWYRCVPLAAGSLVAVNYLLKKGHFVPHPKFGPWPKYIGATVFAYVAGKFTYWGVCKQKLLQLPNSQLAEMYRRRLEMQRPETMVGGRRGTSPEPRREHHRSSSSADPTMTSHDQRLESHDTFTPQDQYLEQPADYDRNETEPIPMKYHNDDPTKRSQKGSSYDELRQKHRERMTRKHQFPAAPVRGARSTQDEQEVWEQNQSANSSRTYQTGQAAASIGSIKNQYGDVWEK